MSTEVVVHLARETLMTTLWLAAPILLVVTVASLVISVLQVMTSVQDVTVATVPRLLAVGGVCLLLMPWILRRLMSFVVYLFSDFHPYLG